MLLIKNAKILTMAGPDIERGDILIDGGKISAVGENLKAPQGTEIIDASGPVGAARFRGRALPPRHVGGRHGLRGRGRQRGDRPRDAAPAGHRRDQPRGPCFREAREAGVTTACTGPGSANVIGGQFAAVKTWGVRIDDMILREPLALKAALGENPKRTYSEQKKSPSTRMASAALFREAMVSAQEYKKKMGGEHAPERSLKMEILVDALEGRLPVKIHAHRADDILTAIRIAKEFGLNYSIEHCTEGYMIPEILLRENVKIIVGPLLSERSKIELKNLTYEAPRILHEAGVKFALMTDHPVIPLQYLPVTAALAVREGLETHGARGHHGQRRGDRGHRGPRGQPRARQGRRHRAFRRQPAGLPREGAARVHQRAGSISIGNKLQFCVFLQIQWPAAILRLGLYSCIYAGNWLPIFMW